MTWLRSLLLASAALTGCAHADRSVTLATLPSFAFDEAVELAKEAQRTLIVVPSSVTCAECPARYAALLHDPAARRIIASDGVVLELDVDADPELADQLGLQARPMAVLVSVEGERKAVELTDTTAAELRAFVGEPGSSRIEDPGDWRAHRRLVRQLRQQRAYQAAADEYVELWLTAGVDAQVFVPSLNSFVLREMAMLTVEYPPAYSQFVDLPGLRRGRFERRIAFHRS